MDIYNREEDTVLISIERYEELLRLAKRRRRNMNYCRQPYKPIKDETWSDIEFTEGEYKISDHGRVMHVATKMICAQSLNGDKSPHLYVTIKYKSGISTRRVVKDLVHSMFRETIQRGTVVQHVNGDVKDNRLVNLKLVKRVAGGRKASARLKFKKYMSKQGFWKMRPSSLSNNDLHEIRRMIDEGVSQIDIATQFNVSKGYISQVVKKWKQ